MRASGYERDQSDWYVEPRWLVDAMLDVEPISGLTWEPSCGGGNIVDAIRARGLECMASDIVQRGAADDVFNFFEAPQAYSADNIVSNPPFNALQLYVDHALTRARCKVVVLGRLAFLEGQRRKDWFKAAPLARVWVSSRRASMPPGGKDTPATGGSIAYAWFVFEHSHTDAPVIGWI